MTAEEIAEAQLEAQLDADLAIRNSAIRQRLLIDPDFRHALHLRHERVLADRKNDGEWVQAWFKLWSASKRVRTKGAEEIVELHDKLRDPDKAPKKRKIRSQDEEDDEDFGAASEY
jgi:hypothetical protein